MKYYFKKVSENLKSITHVFTVIACLAALLYGFSIFPDNILFKPLNLEYLLYYFYIFLIISIFLLTFCLLEPLFSLNILTQIYIRLTKQKAESLYEKSEGIPDYDNRLLFPTLFLTGIGIVLIYSFTTQYSVTQLGSATIFLRNQSVYSFIGIVLLVVFRHIPYKYYKKLSMYIILIFVVIYGFKFIQIKFNLFDNRSSYDIPFKEYLLWDITRILFTINMASILNEDKIKLFSIMPILLITIEVLAIYQEIRYEIIFTIASISIVLVITKLINIHKRLVFSLIIFILVFSLSFFVIYKFYQLSNYLGGFWGSGIGKGVGKFPSNKYILLLILEEMGLVGLLIIVGLFFLILLSIMSGYHQYSDKFARSIIIGSFVIFLLQLVFHFSSYFDYILPNSQRIPFLSYGYSQLYSNFILIGVIMNIKAKTRLKKKIINMKNSLLEYRKE